MAKKAVKRKKLKSKSSVRSRPVKSKPKNKITITKANRTIAVLSVVAIIIVILVLIKYSSKVPEPKVMDGLPSDQLLAKVNGESVMLSELKSTYDKLSPDMRTFLSPAMLLNQTIAEKAILQEADKLGITVQQTEVDQFVSLLMMQSGMSQEEFETALAGEGLSIEDLKKAYEKQLRAVKLLNETVFSKIEVTDEEIIEAYGEEIRARHILVNSTEEAEEIIGLLDDGEDFAELAKERSTGPSGPSGGELPVFGKGAMVLPFEEAAFELEVEEYTKEPVETQFGFHVIQRIEKETSIEQSRGALEQRVQLAKRNDATTEYIEELLERTDVEIVVDPATITLS